MEFSTYELALQKYSAKIKTTHTPLNSWDFHSENFYTFKNSIADTLELTNLASSNKWIQNWNLQSKLQNETIIVVTDVHLKIVFASKNIVKMNGYLPSEVIGQHPKMFQGEATNLETSKEIGLAIKNQKPFKKVITNYCKDGSLYRCEIQGFPIFDKSGTLINFIAFEKMVA